MNADSVALIIDNRQEWADDAYCQVASIMRSYEMLPGMANAGEATQAVAETIGDSIREMIARHALTDHGMADDSKTMTATLFFTALDHINWEDVGRHYYVLAEGRYAVATGQR